MLVVLVQAHPVRRTRAQLATLAGFTASGGTFQNYFGKLRRLGLVEERGDGVAPTDLGLAAVGEVSPAPQSSAEIVAMWKQRLLRGEAKMLDVLVESYPGWMSRDDLGEAAGFTASGGTFQNYLGTLRRNGLVEVEERQTRASPSLFVDGA